MCKSILRHEIVYWDIQEYTGIYKSILRCTRVYWAVQEYTKIYKLVISVDCTL